MAASSSSASLLNSLSFLSLSSSETPPPSTTVTLSSLSSSSNPSSLKTLTINQPPITPVIREISPDVHSLLFPALAFSNTLFFKTPYNVQVIVSPDEPEESLIGRFRREVFRGNILKECKHRRFFETNQEKRKRKHRDADIRRARIRRPRPPIAKKEDAPRKKDVDDDDDDDKNDNWDLIDVELPYCR